MDFPTRYNKTSCFTVDNIFIDNSRLNMFKVFPIIHGLSELDVQYLILYNVQVFLNKRLTTEATISNFCTLKDESWRDVSIVMLTEALILVLNSFLTYFESCFPMHHTTKKLITLG
jgi:hypothetical protein